MAEAPTQQVWDIAIVGGCGHVGLPLGIALASRGASLVLLDHAEEQVALVNSDAPIDQVNSRSA